MIRFIGPCVCFGMVGFPCIDASESALYLVEVALGHYLSGLVAEWGLPDGFDADEVADFGRRRVGPAVIDDRRNLSGICSRWYPVLLSLHRFFIAIPRPVVNHDGRDGTAPDPMVWSAGAHPKRRRVVHAVRDRAFYLGHLVFGIRKGFMFLHLLSVLRTLLVGPIPLVFWVKWVSFLNNLHWPADGSESWGWWHFLCGAAHSF